MALVASPRDRRPHHRARRTPATFAVGVRAAQACIASAISIHAPEVAEMPWWEARLSDGPRMAQVDGAASSDSQRRSCPALFELGAAAYAIKVARAGATAGESEAAGLLECKWQRDLLPEAIRELVLDDQRIRNDLCWSVFGW